jgi:large subunit ribosomal protein L16
VQKGARPGNATRNNKLDFGDYGLQVLDRGLISANQIEAARVAVTRHLNRRGQIWLRIFPAKPITAKPLETRMGKGKGAVEYWAVNVKPGNMILEISGCTEAVAKGAFSRAASKLPMRCKMLSRHAAV